VVESTGLPHFLEWLDGPSEFGTPDFGGSSFYGVSQLTPMERTVVLSLILATVLAVAVILLAACQMPLR
jgi:hypothetical protein